MSEKIDYKSGLLDKVKTAEKNVRTRATLSVAAYARHICFHLESAVLSRSHGVHRLNLKRLMAAILVLTDSPKSIASVL